MQTLTQIRQLLESRGLKPRHRLGQNFLHDQNQITKLVDAAEIKPGELVLEVGPGTGALTEALLGRGADVIACELDDGLADLMQDQFLDLIREPDAASPTSRGDTPRLAGSFRLIRGDALAKHRHLNPEIIDAIAGRSFKLISNLPYDIASALMSMVLINHDNCVGEFVTIQREVADRLMAKPSTKEYGPLTIIVQALAEVKRIGVLSPSCFWPQPEVTSAMVAITRKAQRLHFSRDEFPEFAAFVIGLFSKRRKQLGTILGRTHTNWPDGVTADLRPEALSVEQLMALWICSKKSD